MPTYLFYCPECGERKEIIKPMSQSGKREVCDCGASLIRDYAGEHVNSGNKEYGKTKFSDSLAVNPNQIAEHQRLFPNIRMDSAGRPGFDNVQQHKKYLEKTGFEKVPQKIKRKGIRIA